MNLHNTSEVNDSRKLRRANKNISSKVNFWVTVTSENGSRSANKTWADDSGLVTFSCELMSENESNHLKAHADSVIGKERN